MSSSLIVTGLCAAVLAVGGGLLTTIGPWYRELRKPSWQPPDWLFGPAWTLILGLAAWSASLAWDAAPPGQRPVVIGLFAFNAICHFCWSPLFFRWRRPDLALIEAVVLWLSLVALVAWLPLVSVLAAWLIAPYLAWVSFAICLNTAIVRLNRPVGVP